MDLRSFRRALADDPVRLMWWVLGATLLVKLALAAAFPLTHDEAYFTMWAEHPALGYSEHPPMIGWVLWPILQLGKTRFLVRLPAVVSTIVIGWGLYRLLRDRGEERAAWAAILFLASPLNLIYIIITTDTPLIFFSCWSLYAFYRAHRSGRLAWYAASGLLLSFAFLSKYFAVLLGLAYLVAHLLLPKNRQRTLGMLLLYLCVLPAGALDIYWNYHHSWLQVNSNLFYRHVRDGPNLMTPLLYLATVVYLLLPAGAILWWRARRGLVERLRTHDAVVIAVVYLMPMTVFGLLSIVKTIGLHWLLSFAVLPFAITWAVAEVPAIRRASRFTGWYSAVHLLIIALALLMPKSLLAGSSSYAKIVVAVYHEELAAEIEPFTEGRMLAADGYGIACQLTFYNPGFFSHFSVGNHHGRQDDIVTDWNRWAGRDAFILHDEPPDMGRYDGIFDEVRVETIEVRGQAFYLVLGDRLNFDGFRERYLVSIRDRYYDVPDWLPMDRCFFRERYFGGAAVSHPDSG